MTKVDANNTTMPGSHETLRMRIPNHFEALLDDDEASSLLCVHPKTLQKLARRGEIPAYRVGRFWRYRASELDEWLRSKAQSARQPADCVDFTKDGKK